MALGSEEANRIIYLKAKITYEHDRRVETYPFARNAIREAIYFS